MADETVAKVMKSLEQFYEQGSDNGKDIYEAFAKEHGDTFSAESDALGGENKLEWTPIYEKFCALFEQHIECKAICRF